jgi:hypothetical protein
MGPPTYECDRFGVATHRKEHTVTTTQTRRNLVMAAVIAATTAPALLFLGSGTALAVQDVSDAAPGDTISTLMMVKCPVPPLPPEPQSPCDLIPSLSWWPEPRPTAVIPQGWLDP